jgi:NAD(P)-dependent dehydrogenase (short-subunit alcohol dehydrogenase family)
VIISLKDKVAVVTGGTSGIGLAIAQRFVDDGARVYITGRRRAQLDAAVAQLGPNATPVQCDVGVLDELDALYDVVREQSGRIDILVANAGGAERGDLREITEEQFDWMFTTNVKGIVFGVQKALPLLSRGASVILIGSTTSARPDPGLDVYSATKAAVRNFARSWARDSATRGFRVNVLSPGPTRTPALEGAAPDGQADAFLAKFGETVPIGRIGEPAEIASVAAFLASSEAVYVNGAEWFVDGGYAQVI